MKTFIYQIEAITNLHVGNGEINMGVIDNLIQLDAATKFPVINASSLKGALREHFMYSPMKDKICTLFGSAPSDTQKHEAGSLRIFDANLLSMPVRSNRTPFLMGTCPMLIEDYINKRQFFGMQLAEEKIHQLSKVLKKAKRGVPVVTRQEHTNAFIEDFAYKTEYIGDDITAQTFNELTGSPSVLFSNEDFRRLCDEDHLPVMARNNLMKGHENLWYEQILPRFSRLYFYVLSSDDTVFPQFHEYLTQHMVQIGANATVGYGYCKLTPIS